MLIIFSGLPGSGKTTLARALAMRLQAVHLRIDTIEQALRDAGPPAGEIGVEGYAVAYALAADNLRSGLTVIADSVNPLPVTRNAWLEVASRCSVAAVEIEVICSDATEHRRRVETRQADIAGLRLPNWHDVERRDYAPWSRSHLIIDTANRTIEAALDEIVATLEHLLSGVTSTMMRLTSQQAYRAMFYLWEGFYRTTKSNGIGSMLGGLSWDIWTDKKSGDPAFWEYWKAAVEKALSDGLNTPRNEDRS